LLDWVVYHLVISTPSTKQKGSSIHEETQEPADEEQKNNANDQSIIKESIQAWEKAQVKLTMQAVKQGNVELRNKIRSGI
jgi:hypothetical protein